MQLYAEDRKGNIVSSKSALKHKNYFCLECKGTMRRRGGLHRHDHFFHLESSSSCSQNGKGILHLLVQKRIQSLIQDEIILEKRFPQIQRIADVVWEKEKIIFEIQCSQIKPEEVQARQIDYAILGYHVIWIVHEKRFNRKRLSLGEIAMVESGCYYTNIDEEGNGVFYDQWDRIRSGYRKTLWKCPKVNIAKPLKNIEDLLQDCPKMPFEPPFRRKIHFSDDLFHVLLEKNCHLMRMIEHETKRRKRENFLRILFYLRNGVNRILIRPYRILFNFLLENAC